MTRTINDRSRRRPLLRALRRRRSLRAGLVQLVYVGVAVVAGVLITPLDVGPRIPTAEAVALMAGVTAGLLALTGIIFALLFLVVQFAATAQSPRLHLFRDNPLVWHTLGLIVGVMVFATTSAIVASFQDTVTIVVPVVVVVLVLLAVAVTRRLQVDALRSVQLSSVLDEVTSRCHRVIEGLYPTAFPGSAGRRPATPDRIVEIRWPGSPRLLRQIDLPDLIDLARSADAVISLRVMPGELIRRNAVVLEIWDPIVAPDPASLLHCLEVGIDRNLTQDPLFGFRLLNDIALRAVSTAVNDPATAVQALDSIEGLLLTLVDRDLAIDVITDDTGTPRVILDAPDWERFLAAGADEISGLPMHPIVRQRLHTMLQQILSIAPIERRPAVERRAAALDRDSFRITG
jgi:uncharacterized membrane protein